MKPIEQLSDDEFAHLVQQAVCLPDAPAALVERAIGLWSTAAISPAPSLAAQTAKAVQALQDGLRAVAAVLTFDSAARPALAYGMRAMGHETRHLLFSAQGRDIDLRISPSAGRFDLAGQILGPDESGTVELARRAEAPMNDRDARPALLARLDELGEFRLEGVDSGTVWLTIRTGGDEITLPPIDVGSSTE
jgi:hypothetical protein